MGEFENNFIEYLALRTARSMIRRNMGTMLAYIADTKVAGTSETHVLHIMGYVQFPKALSVLLLTIDAGTSEISRRRLNL
jgi:hypothetical protein